MLSPGAPELPSAHSEPSILGISPRNLPTVDELPGSVPFTGGRLTHALSVASLDSHYTVRTGRSTRSLSPAPPARGCADGSATRRRFSSRHVPSVAEELVKSQVLTPEIVTRFNGLMRHLKRNTDWEEQQKQVMVSNMEDMVPEEYDEMLRSEFERRCEFGERTNTEMMTSAKWARWMRDIGAIISPDRGGGPSPRHRGRGAVELAEADIIFRKVLHDCDYGGRKLTYELFCKALYLLALSCRPDLDGEAAFAEILGRIAAILPEDAEKPDESVDYLLDPNVTLVLDHFKPALHDLFTTFCKRHLSNPSSASHGMGTVRIRERTTWKHTQETIGTTMGAGLTSTDFGSPMHSPTRRSRAATLQFDVGTSSPASGARSQSTATLVAHFAEPASETLGEPVAGQDASPNANAREEDEVREPPSPAKCSEADAGGGLEGIRRRSLGGSRQADAVNMAAAMSPHHVHLMSLGSPSHQGHQPMTPRSPSPVRSPGGLSAKNTGRGIGAVLAWAETRGWVCQSNTLMNTTCSSVTSVQQDPYLYANGAPVIKQRHRYMSCDQMMSLCKELKVLPDLLSRNEVVKVFKRAQMIGAHTTAGSSIHGYITKEAFVAAVGHLALDSYSKEPYCDEYPEPHEKVHAFLLSVLPGSAREVRERFLWGCGGRGR